MQHIYGLSYSQLIKGEAFHWIQIIYLMPINPFLTKRQKIQSVTIVKEKKATWSILCTLPRYSLIKNSPQTLNSAFFHVLRRTVWKGFLKRWYPLVRLFCKLYQSARMPTKAWSSTASFSLPWWSKLKQQYSLDCSDSGKKKSIFALVSQTGLVLQTISYPHKQDPQKEKKWILKVYRKVIYLFIFLTVSDFSWWA